jgi:signal transduction histidine kinase
MRRQVQSINRLVEDMREISHVEHGKIQLHKPLLDLEQAIVRAVETVRPFVAERGHHLEVVLPSESMLLEADSSQLEQILTNRLNNAAKYMEPGGRIWVMAESEGGDDALLVRDCGTGIDLGMLPHVFDPFRQVERAHSFARRTGNRLNPHYSYRLPAWDRFVSMADCSTEVLANNG